LQLGGRKSEGVDESVAPKAAGISVYPNPVNDVLFISSEKSGIGEVKIYDSVGKLILEKLIEGNEGEINMTGLISGIYFIELHKVKINIIKR
jgi:hypothetical protein